jgi:hypothetical protein
MLPRMSRRRALWFLGPAAVVALLLALLSTAWYATAPERPVTVGVNYSCMRAEHLGMDCDAALATILDDLGARHLRLSVYWNDVEQTRGVYDWSMIDRELAAVHARGGRAVVSIGMKAQRFPEYWLPDWLKEEARIPPTGMPEDHEIVRRRLFPFLDAAARHLAAHPAVEAIQVENEPYVNYRPNRLLRLIGREEYGPGERKTLRIAFLTFGWNATPWYIRPAFLAEEVATVRAAAPGMPIVLNHASWLRSDAKWRSLVDLGDVLGQSIYTRRQQGPWGWMYLFPYQNGPLAPDLPAQAAAAARQGKQMWITELQAEPFEKSGLDPRDLPPGRQVSLTPRWLAKNIQLARRTGATRVYLWGVEWWLYARDRHGDAALWEAGRALFDGDDEGAADVR